MKTKKFLAIAALAAGFVSCSSEDEFVQSQNGNATKGESTIELAGYDKGKANSRAISTDIPAGDTDFAATESKDIRVFFAENTTAGIDDVQTYSETGYKYTALNGNLTQVLESGQDKPMWALRTANTDISCYAFYPVDVVYQDKFLATTGTTSNVAGTGDDFDKMETDLAAHCAGELSKISTFDASPYNTKLIVVPTDQSSLADYQKADVLVGYPNDSKTWTMAKPKAINTTNKLKFYHAGNKVTVKLAAPATPSADQYMAEELAMAKVELLNWPITGAVYPKEYVGYGGFCMIRPLMNQPNVTDAAGKKFTTASGSIGTVIIAANTIGETLGCSALIPFINGSLGFIPKNESTYTSSYAFRITIDKDVMVWYLSNLTQDQLKAKTTPGQEFSFTLTINKNKPLPIELTTYSVEDWTKSEYQGSIDNK